PGSIHGHAEMFATVHYRAWTEAGRSLQTGEPAFEHVFGLQLFDWLAEHPEGSELFNRSMAASARARQAALLARDWSDVETIVDVGGGTGTMLTSLLAQEPQSARGGLRPPAPAGDGGDDRRDRRPGPV